MGLIKAKKVYADDDDFQWTDSEAEDESSVSSSEEDEESPERLDEANFGLIRDKRVKSIVEMTIRREKEIFTGEGKKFAYPTEWRSNAGCGKLRFKIHRLVDGLPVRLFAMILIVVDVAVVLVSVTKGITTPLAVVSGVIVTYFMLELLLRIFAWGKQFFKDWLEVFDGVVVVIAFFVTVVIDSIRFIYHKEVKYGSLVVVLRSVRLFLYLRMLYHTGGSVYMALRYKATQSKKRYVLEGYDLDLTYITNNVIAMSFPSSGVREIQNMNPDKLKVDLELALRNPKEEVARFFNEKYPDGRYKIYNLCKERAYNTECFNCQVARYKIPDHNVPKMSELLDFCRDVESYMKEHAEGNVIAVHCKGGKGRTGCCIAAWLLYSGQFTTAEAALDYFGGRRMDVAKGVKFQGVETPSQKRYVKYLETLINKMGRKMPPVKQLIVKTLEIKGLEEEVYSDLRMEIVVDDEVKHKIKLTATGTKMRRKIYMTFNDDIMVAGDVKFRFKSKKLKKDYDNCAFFFWLHTSFIERNRFEAGRYKIGNANKPKHHDEYSEEFHVKLTFFDPLKKCKHQRSLDKTGDIDSDWVILEVPKEDCTVSCGGSSVDERGSDDLIVAEPDGGTVDERGSDVIVIEPDDRTVTERESDVKIVIDDGTVDFSICKEPTDNINSATDSSICIEPTDDEKIVAYSSICNEPTDDENHIVTSSSKENIHPLTTVEHTPVDDVCVVVDESIDNPITLLSANIDETVQIGGNVNI